MIDTPDQGIIVRLETLAMVEAALVFDDKGVLEILHGSDCPLEQRAIDAITLACYLIWRTDDPPSVLARLRAMAIANDPDVERDDTN